MEQLIQEELVKLQETISELSQAITESMQPFVESIQAIAKSTQPFVESIQAITQPLVESTRLLSESMERRRRIIQAFQACDLWPVPSMKGLTDKIVQLYDDGKKQVIPSVVSRYYKKNDHAILRKAVSRWEDNSFFRPRMGIIYDALETHINGKYTLSIPTLLPHIEGIARRIVETYNLPERSKLKDPLICREVHCGKKGAITWPSAIFGEVAIGDFTGWIAAESLLYFLEGTLYISQGDFQKNLDRLERESRLNRHSILHGIQIKYATPMNSLRCFLVLDALSSLIDFYYSSQN